MMEIKAPENILISYVYSPHTLAEKLILRGYSIRIFYSI